MFCYEDAGLHVRLHTFYYVHTCRTMYDLVSQDNRSCINVGQLSKSTRWTPRATASASRARNSLIESFIWFILLHLLITNDRLHTYVHAHMWPHTYVTQVKYSTTTQEVISWLLTLANGYQAQWLWHPAAKELCFVVVVALEEVTSIYVLDLKSYYRMMSYQ